MILREASVERPWLTDGGGGRVSPIDDVEPAADGRDRDCSFHTDRLSWPDPGTRSGPRAAHLQCGDGRPEPR